MIPPRQTSVVDPVLDAVLAARDPAAPAWEDVLPAEDHEDAAAWDALADDLAGALRIRPGGLSDAQRERILDAAAHPVVLATGPWVNHPQPRAAAPKGLPSSLKWIAGAGVAAALILWVGAGIPVSPGIDAAAWRRHFQPSRTDPGDYRVRLLCGELAGSRYVRQPAVARTNPGLPADGNAIGGSGGFQPAAMANVAEWIPVPLPMRPVAEILNPPDARSPAIATGLINAFAYNYPEPARGEALALVVEAGPCPWRPGNLLVHVGLRATSDPRLAPGLQSIVASDVRLTLDFNPRLVAAYRPVGQLPGHSPGDTAVGADFANGQCVTALYEIVPVGAAGNALASGWRDPGVGDPLHLDDLLTARVHFRPPGSTKSLALAEVLRGGPQAWSSPSVDFHFLAAVAAFGMLHDQAPGMQRYGVDDALALAHANLGADNDGRRGEFLRVAANAAGRRAR